MASERPPAVASSVTAKPLARPVLTGRSIVRKAGPRPCNLPSMKRSNINDTNHVEIVPASSIGWAKTPKPTDDCSPGSVTNTWTVPPRVPSDRTTSVKNPNETKPSDPVKASDPKPVEVKVNDPTPVAGSSSSAIENPFGVDIDVSSWAREVSPPPPAKRAWSDASPMDFTKPVVFQQAPATTAAAAAAARHTGPPSETNWRPAVVRKPAVSSILKKPDSGRTAPEPAIPSPVHQTDQANAPAPAALHKTIPPTVDETVQAMTMKQKAEEAVRRRQEQEQLREQEVRSRLAEKLAALEKKTIASSQPAGSAPISVMRRPKPAEPDPVPSSDSKHAEPGSDGPAPPCLVASDSASHVDVRHPAVPNSNEKIRNNQSRSSSGHEQGPRDEHKPAGTGRRGHHSHRRHHDPPGSKSSTASAWTRASAEGGSAGRLSDKPANEGEKLDPVSERESPRDAAPSKEIGRREDRLPRRSAKVMNRNEPTHGSAPEIPSAPDSHTTPLAKNPSGNPKPKSAHHHHHRKWRAKEPASSKSPPASTAPVHVSTEPTSAPTPVQDKPAPSVPRHAPRQWKSPPPDRQQPASDADKKRHRPPKRGGGRRPIPLRGAFENAPVVGSEAGTLTWSTAAPVVGSGPVLSGSAVTALRAWSTPKPSKSHNAELLSQQQSRAKGSPGAILAKLALAETLASRSN